MICGVEVLLPSSSNLYKFVLPARAMLGVGQWHTLHSWYKVIIRLIMVAN